MGFLSVFKDIGQALTGTETPGLGGDIAGALLSAGIGLTLEALGALISGKPITGFATTLRNPYAPWTYLYGYSSVGGTMVYMNFYGDNNNTVDIILVLADHPCQIDTSHPPTLLFDRKRVTIDASQGLRNIHGYSGRSFTPVQQTIKLNQSGPVTGSIVRTNGVVTVTCPANIPYLVAGEYVSITNLPTISGNQSLNNAVQSLLGKHQVVSIVTQVFGSPGYIVFTFLSGGLDVNISAAGWVHTDWSDYGNNIYVEWVDGTQTLADVATGPLFQGMSVVVPGATTESLFGVNCALTNKTAMFLRLTYDQSKFPGGLPQISTEIYGKNNIYDPRLGPPGPGGSTTGYTAYTSNAALCIADFLADGYLGYDCEYGVDIPTAELVTAANQCDTSVALAAGGSEPMYQCNGKFESTTLRGEVFKKMLASCAGRFTDYGGQIIIWPGVWNGASPTAVDLKAIAAGAPVWRPICSITERYNACKGTYVSSSNKWQSTDFPAYAQDSKHGYSGPSMYGGDINLASDNGERRYYEIQLQFTTSASMAQRIAKIYLLRTRFAGLGTFPVNMAGYSITPTDVLAVTHAGFGWSGKQLEVVQGALGLKKSEGGDSYYLDYTIDAQETDSSIFAWSTEEELTAQGFTQSFAQNGQAPETFPWPWSPGFVAPLAGDAVWSQGATGPGTFGMVQTYPIDAQGNVTALLQITGYPPASAVDTQIAKPSFGVTAGTGGSLAAGQYVVGLAARSSGASTYSLADFLGFQIVTIPASSGSIGVTITWGAGDDGGDLYVAEWNAAGAYSFHHNQFVASSSTTATITALDQSTSGSPDPDFDHFSVTWMAIIHSGSWADRIAAVTSTTITIGANGMTTNQWAGYILSLLAKYGSTPVPVLNMPVASSTASSGSEFTMTIGPNSASVQLPDLTTLLAPQDLVVMRFKATFTATGFSDPNIANGFYPSGANSGKEAGLVAVVLTGADAGDVQPILSVTQDGSLNYTIYTLVNQWQTTPTTGDIVIVCDPTLAPEVPFGVSVQNPSAPVFLNINVANLTDQAWLVLVRTEDANGVSCPDAYAPKREIYFYGAGGTAPIVTATGTMV